MGIGQMLTFLGFEVKCSGQPQNQHLHSRDSDNKTSMMIAITHRNCFEQEGIDL